MTPVRVCIHTPHTPLAAPTQKSAARVGGQRAREHNTKPDEIWNLSFRAEGEGPPAEIRVRRFLKVALRRFGLKCVDYACTSGPAKS